jgi:aspartate/methionine/tyrosine aminotransferase
MTATYESRAAAYSQAAEHLRNHPQDKGWFVCRRKDGSFVLWPMVSTPPASYKVVDEVYR